MNIDYGLATAHELPRIVALKLEMFRESSYYKLLAEDVEPAVLEDYHRMYLDGTARHFVARVDGEIIAMTGAFIKSDIPYRYFNPACYGFIGDVYTALPFRRNGVSTKLNQHAVDWFRELGITTVRLLASDAGRMIYERLGFQATDEMALSLAT